MRRREVLVLCGALLVLVLSVTAPGCGGNAAAGGEVGEDVSGGGDVPGLPDTGPGDDVANPDTKHDDAPPPVDLPGDDVGVPPDVYEDVAEDVGVEDVAPQDVASDAGDAGAEVFPGCPPGLFCDDGDPCTTDDRCTDDGGCQGTAVVCDDGRECTDDYCDETGSCAATLHADACLIDAACQAEGASPEGNPCLVCDPDTDPARWTAVDGTCDDGDACTLGDHCFEGTCVPSGAIFCETVQCHDVACDAQSGDCVATPLDGGTCDDGDACTTGDTCVGGVCAGATEPCPNDNPCVEALCDSATGCYEQPVEGPCDDGDACTVGDTCGDGTCQGLPRDCDDANVCTEDSCHVLLGCNHEPVDSPCCEDGVPACDDGEPCTLDECAPDGGCTHTPFVGECDDGDACTTDDTCDAEGRCAGEAVSCDDANPCTADSCDEALGCRHAFVTGECDDGDPCTLDDACVAGRCVGEDKDCDDADPCTADACDDAGECQHAITPGVACDDLDACTVDETCDAEGDCGGGTARDCDDGDLCTADLCDPTTGCAHLFNTAPCDDGDECTTDDTCDNGQCVGVPGGCVCEPTLSADASKVTGLAIGANGHPGNGLDVDEDPSTCAPTGTCSAGINNAMAVLADLANEPLGGAVADGSVLLIFEHVDLRTDGAPYLLALLIGAEVSPPGCDFQAATCGYVVERASFDPDTCEPLITFDNANIIGDQLTAGGLGYTFPFQIPFQGLSLEVAVYDARIAATASFDGGALVGMSGLIAGAIPKQQIIDAVMAIPDEQFAALGITRDTVLTLINVFIVADIQVEVDGVMVDAASIGILFDAIDGDLVGVTAP